MPGLLRLSPLRVVADPSASVASLVELGAVRVESGSPACLGVTVGASASLFVTRDHLAADFGARVAAALEHRAIFYAHVVDAEAASRCFSGRPLADAVTAAGTREIVRDDGDHVVILAQRLGTERTAT
ncbi:MAG: hypothetical protein ABTQ29_00300 [Siculibacillus sp.]